MPKYATIVKNINSLDYDNYLQKIKRNSVKQSSLTTNATSNGCKSCVLSSKKVLPPAYETYLNSIKSNIVKNKHSIIGINLDCNCHSTTCSCKK